MKLVPTPRHGKERGVSPVIGIVLFISVSVILMAGIGAAIVGFDAFQTTPQADLVYEEDPDEDELTIGVKSATGLTGSETHIQIQGEGDCGGWDDLGGGSGTIESGDTVTFDTNECPQFDGGDLLQVIGADTLVSTYEVRG